MKKILNITIIALISLSISGCGVYRRYSRPESTPAADSSLYRQSGIPGTSAAAIYWKDIFRDSLLRTWIDSALVLNADLSTAKLKVREAEASLKAAKLSFLPSAGISASAGIDGTAGKNHASTKSYSVSADAGLELDVAGSRLNSKRQAEATLMKSEAAENSVRSRLIATVADTYYSLLLLDRKKEITEETIVNREENLKVLEALKRAGASDEAAVSQAKASLLDACASLIDLERQILALENSFSVLVGITPRQISRSRLEEWSLTGIPATGLPIEILDRRPDVIEAEAALAECFYGLNYARSELYPKVTLSGTLGWTDKSGGSISNPSQWIFNALGSIVQTIFARGEKKAAVRIAEARLEAAMINYRQKILEAGEEVNNALAQCQSAAARAEIDREKTMALESAVKSTTLLMKHSSVNYLEVLTANQSLLEAMLKEAENIYSGIQGVINLYCALGGGAVVESASGISGDESLGSGE
ncbi:MAG: TolC family protein [Candidatus Cryptobacteroides sp.]